ncbi:MAG: hypothetical protein PGN34_05455 [Methylobacterium frigidaeris]
MKEPSPRSRHPARNQEAGFRHVEREPPRDGSRLGTGQRSATLRSPLMALGHRNGRLGSSRPALPEIPMTVIVVLACANLVLASLFAVISVAVD